MFWKSRKLINRFVISKVKFRSYYQYKFYTFIDYSIVMIKLKNLCEYILLYYNFRCNFKLLIKLENAIAMSKMEGRESQGERAWREYHGLSFSVNRVHTLTNILPSFSFAYVLRTVLLTVIHTIALRASFNRST